MGAIKVIKFDDGKPYISLEDLTNELETLKNTMYMDDDNPPEILDVILHTLNAMEQEYYTNVFTYTEYINPQSNDETEPDPAETEIAIYDPESDLVMKLLQSFKLMKRKLNKEQSMIADEIDGIAGASLTCRNFESPEELNNFKKKMIGIRTICSHSNLKYENWTMLVDAFQTNSMTVDEIVEMIQQRIQNGNCKKSK